MPPDSVTEGANCPFVGQIPPPMRHLATPILRDLPIEGANCPKPRGESQTRAPSARGTQHARDAATSSAITSGHGYASHCAITGTHGASPPEQPR